MYGSEESLEPVVTVEGNGTEGAIYDRFSNSLYRFAECKIALLPIEAVLSAFLVPAKPPSNYWPAPEIFSSWAIIHLSTHFRVSVISVPVPHAHVAEVTHYLLLVARY